MNKLTLLFIFFSDIFPFIFSQKLGGPFYIINEGFFPRAHNSASMGYVSEIRPMKTDYDDKRMHGKFHIKEKIKNISFTIQSWRESAKMWLKCGPVVEHPNLCNVTFSTMHFMNAFTGKLNQDDCSLNAGNYTLTDYSFEFDLRDTIGNNFFYGHYKYSITINGTRDGAMRDTITFEMMMWVKDLEEKPKSGSGKDNKIYPSKFKGGNGKKN